MKDFQWQATKLDERIVVGLRGEGQRDTESKCLCNSSASKDYAAYLSLGKIVCQLIGDDGGLISRFRQYYKIESKE